MNRPLSVKVSVEFWEKEPLARIRRHSAETSPLLANASGENERIIQESQEFHETAIHPLPSWRRLGGVFYCQDAERGKQVSLRTKDKAEAHTLLHAKNESVRQSILNLQIARTYLQASDPAIAARTWQDVMNEMTVDKEGSTFIR